MSNFDEEVIAKAEASYEQPPVGMNQAVCVYVHNIGTQKSEYQGQMNIRKQVIITWELAEKMQSGDYAGQPFLMSKYYTLSLSEKANLRKDLGSWRGRAFNEEELKGFSLNKLIGVNCFLNVTQNDKGKSIISAITPLAKGVPLITVTNPIPSEKFKAWIDKERAKSLEEQAKNNPQHAVDDEPLPPIFDKSSDLPF